VIFIYSIHFLCKTTQNNTLLVLLLLLLLLLLLSSCTGDTIEEVKSKILHIFAMIIGWLNINGMKVNLDKFQVIYKCDVYRNEYITVGNQKNYRKQLLRC